MFADREDAGEQLARAVLGLGDVGNAIVLGLLRLYHRRYPKVAARAARRRAVETFAKTEEPARHEHRVH